MARYVTRVRTPWSAEEAFAYMADLRNFAHWDPGVERVDQVEGDGAGPGASFDVRVKGPGRAIVLRYETVNFDEPVEVFVRASTRTLTSEDRITVEPETNGCVVTYDADLRLNGPLRLADPMMILLFKRIGDRAAAGLRTALGGTDAGSA